MWDMTSTSQSFANGLGILFPRIWKKRLARNAISILQLQWATVISKRRCPGGAQDIQNMLKLR